MLHPLVRILLKHEIAHSEFAELAKRAYVDVAYQYFSLPNRKQTFSRVSVLTGLSRKEVVRLTNVKKDAAPVTKGPLNRAVRVISGWLRDPDFLDKNNDPKVLPLRGEVSSFEQLVARYSGDITARAILDELIRVGAVKKIQNTKVKLMHHGYIPDASLPEKLDVLSTHAHDLLTTGIHNLTQDQKKKRFQRQVTYQGMPQSVIDEFQDYSHDKCLALLLEFDRWLAEKEKNVQAKPGEPIGRVGIGIYYFNNDKEDL